MKNRQTRIPRSRLRSSYFTTIMSMALVLFMLSLLGFLILNARNLADQVKENIGFSVILKENVKEADIIQVQKYFDASPAVKETAYIPPEKAAEELQKTLGEDFIDFLGFNPLLGSIDIKLYAAYANPDSIAKIEKEFMGYSQVKDVYYQESLVHLVNENIRKISLVIVGFSAILFIISLALFNNTIRLMVYSKRFIIKTMQLVGATRAYIRRPFMVRGLMHGLIGALLAVVILALVLFIVKKQLPELVAYTDFKTLGILLLLILGLGILLAWISTTLAVNKYLRLDRDALYI